MDQSISIGYDSADDKTSIFFNWNDYGPADQKFVRELFNEAILEVLERHGGFPDCTLSQLPTYRTSKTNILKKIPKSSELQMVPRLPPNMIIEQTGEDFDKSKVSAAYLESKKQKKIYQMIN